jgi:hypothetical protein
MAASNRRDVVPWLLLTEDMADKTTIGRCVKEAFLKQSTLMTSSAIIIVISSTKRLQDLATLNDVINKRLQDLATLNDVINIHINKKLK